MITTISEFEDAMKYALNSLDVLLPTNTEIIFKFGNVQFIAKSVYEFNGKIIVQIVPKTT